MQTPYFIYDADIIRARVAELRDAFSHLNVSLHYAVKACDNPSVITLVREGGIGACLVSAGEMKRAMAGGMKPEGMLMNGVAKADVDLRFALKNGIGQLNLESLPEIPVVAAVAKDMGVRIPVCLRINPEIAAQAHNYTTTARRTDKFGMLIEDIEEAAIIIAEHPELDWRGFSCHIGSQIQGTEALVDSYRVMADLFLTWKEKQPQFDRLDLGGGFGVSYTGGSYARPADYAVLIEETVSDVLKSGARIQLEPGRFIAAEAGTLVTEVRFVKDSGGTRFVMVDAAMNNLLRPSLYGAYHPIAAATVSEAPNVPCTVVGPVCESADQFGTERLLPEDVKPGDRLHIGFAGAYGYSMSSLYNARDLLAEYLKDGSDTRLIRRAFPAEELDRLTLIP